MSYVLSFDEGTTSARAALYNLQGHRIAMASAPVHCQYPNDGWVEQDAVQLWEAQLAAAREALAKARVEPSEIRACGITNQRETTVVWDRETGRPVGPAIVWQCRRTAARCRQIAASPQAAVITAKTGLVVDAYFSASKIEWILERYKGQRERLLFGNVDTWLIWNLTRGRVHATDPTNASRTMLYNLVEGRWDPELAAIFGIPLSMLPEIVPSSGVCGHLAPEWLGAELPIAGIAGDQQAALAGQACFRPGLAKNTYGTGCFALLHAGESLPVSTHRLLSTRAASVDSQPQFAVEGSIFIAGASVQWLRDRLGLLASAAETEAMAESIPSTGGVYLVPAFVGLGAPEWDADARALLCGMTLATGKAEIVRASLEAMAYQTRQLVEAMEADSGAPLRELRADGGAAANGFLLQFQADILDRPVLRPADTETTALGAAYLAGLATGFWKSLEEVESFWKVERRFEPRMSQPQRDSFWSGWLEAVRRARA